MGRIVETCWKEIPEHFENTAADGFQIMPNHVHGIIEIKPRLGHAVGTRHAVSLQGFTGEIFGKPRPGSLSTIIGSFKSAVTQRVHGQGIHRGKSVWQPRFHDRIIRSDIEHYFIQRYVELNPLLWHFDSDNPEVHKTSIDDLRRALRDRHGLDESAVAYVVDCEMNYREWRVL